MSNMQPEEYENTGWLSYFSRHKTTYTASDIHKISNELNNVRKNLTATQYAYGELSSELKALKSLQEQQRASDEYEQRVMAGGKGASAGLPKAAEKRLKEQSEEIKCLKSDLTSCRNELSKQIAALRVACSELGKKTGKSSKGSPAAGPSDAVALSLESRIIAAEIQIDQLATNQTDRLAALEQKLGQLERQSTPNGDGYDARLKALEDDFTRKLQDLTDLVVDLQRKLATSEAKQVEMLQKLTAAQAALYEQLEHRYEQQCGQLRQLQVRLSHLGQRDDIDSTFV
ncbi:uncharacterized protein LOC131282176 [Anopheles ziemanni]|uniref:uncharacterized protein LOC131262829 n=1 Tax=Anopheles coustani TaxID=139045 RepID=UPI002659F237|nr:uncharacterized protein LOC131262829 [Anopheles coustani]XP_058167564.1 uncharacterized protein LOC131282176 [Anopheles ziemanni]